MGKAVLVQNRASIYADEPGLIYDFPQVYLSRVEQVVGDWVIFFESGKGGGRGYYAVQRVEAIRRNPVVEGRWLAVLDPGSLLDFERWVPRERADGSRREKALPATGGLNASAVRPNGEAEFADILAEGFRARPDPEALPRHEVPGFADAQTPFQGAPLAGPRPELLTSRPFRDASFARQVKRAYGARCALSGLELRNGGGRPEVEAAHIRPVSHRGPDSVRNGLALSGTLHWMFDRGLIGVDEDHSVLLKSGSVAGEVAERLLTPERRLLVPDDPALHPHPAYLKWHREHFAL